MSLDSKPLIFLCSISMAELLNKRDLQHFVLDSSSPLKYDKVLLLEDFFLDVFPLLNDCFAHLLDSSESLMFLFNQGVVLLEVQKPSFARWNPALL